MKTVKKIKKRSPSITKTKAKAKTKMNVKLENEDIVQLILKDHKPLKKLIKILKNLDKDLVDRQKAFDEFAPLLVNHYKPEEQTLYVYLKQDAQTRENGLESEIEHNLADQLLIETKRTADDDLWSARVKVLAEIVERHIADEEEYLLPNFKKHTSIEDRRELGKDFIKLKNRFLEKNERELASEPPTEIQVSH
jgi:hemerythrin superfamily protein